MKILVGYIKSPEGEAALNRAVEEARLRDGHLVVLHSERGGRHEDPNEMIAYQDEFERISKQLEEEGISFELREFVRGNEPVDDIVSLSREKDVELIVIGLRRRSPVGKLVLGSNAQDILLQAECPVLAVKAESE